jgi:hypothetical protein
VQLLPTIVPQSAKFNYTKVSEGHKHQRAWFLMQLGIVEPSRSAFLCFKVNLTPSSCEKAEKIDDNRRLLAG